MIVEAKEEDLKKLGRRGFLRMFGATAASAVVAPTKTFVFFGDILRPKAPIIPATPAIPEGIMFKPEWLIGGAVLIGAMLLSPGRLPGMGGFPINVK